MRGEGAAEVYRRAMESGSKLVREARLMIVGQDRAGKTTLRMALTGAFIV